MDSVFELMRRRLNTEISENSFYADNKTSIKIKDFLKITHQRRNCYAHRGECKKNDKMVCAQTSSNKMLCKKFMTEERGKYLDHLLVQLENITERLIYSEIEKIIGEVKISTSYINSILETGDLSL